jgi:hypothetical protein
MAETPRRDVPGLVGCALAVVLGVAAIAHSGDFSALGSVFPRTIAGLMIVLAVLYAVLAWRRPRPRARAEPASTPRRAATAGVLLAWAFLLEPLGFLFTSAIACLALLLIAQYDRWTPRTAVFYGGATLLVLAALYTLFKVVLKVPLPVGVFL